MRANSLAPTTALCSLREVCCGSRPLAVVATEVQPFAMPTLVHATVEMASLMTDGIAGSVAHMVDGGGAVRSVRIGIDIGGTFTDVVAESASGRQHAKVPSTRPDPSQAVTAALAAILSGSGERRGIDPDVVQALAHGTTVATNAMIERTLAEVGLLTTRGFRDVLAIGRQTRSSLYDFAFDPRWVPVDRHRRLEIDERVDHTGAVLVAPDRDDVVARAGELIDSGVDAIAIAFLHSYVNPTHELMAADWISQVYPDVTVWISSHAANEFREYERTSTVVLDAALGDVMSRYLRRFADRAAAAGVDVSPTLMRSSGGVATMGEAAAHPTWTLLSGPAAGVVGAIDVARRAGAHDVLTFDVGGTSADLALIRGGEPEVVSVRHIDGLPVLGTTLNIQAIGAGGGSIGWIDTGGRLRVGPRSAGASPGPAAYGAGGDQPTVTDAYVVTGMLPAGIRLGETVDLDVDAAAAAIDRVVGAPLGLSTVAAAHAMLDVVNTNMALAARRTTVARGVDPRGLTLVAYGGAGPMHAVALARELAIEDVLIPAHPGTLCALGLLVSDMTQEFVRSCFVAVDDEAADRLAATFDELDDEAHRWKDTTGERGEVATTRFADLRYRGQEHALRVEVPAGALDAGLVAHLVDAFHTLHRSINGFAAETEPVEAVNLRVVMSINVRRHLIDADAEPDANPDENTETGSGPGSTASSGPSSPSSPSSSAGSVDGVVSQTDHKELVDVWWEPQCSTPTRVIEWGDFSPGETLQGPLIVLQPDATSVVPPGHVATMISNGAGLIVTCSPG